MAWGLRGASREARHVPVWLVFKPDFPLLLSRYTAKAEPWHKAGRCRLRPPCERYLPCPGGTAAVGPLIPIAPRTGRDEPLPTHRLGRALALGLRGETVQTLLSVFGSNLTGKCTPVTEGLSHPQNDSLSKASSHLLRGRHVYYTPFRGGGARLCNQTHARACSSLRRKAPLVRRRPPPRGQTGGGVLLASARYCLPSSLAREVLRERAHHYSAAPRRSTRGVHAGPPRSP